MQITSSVFQNMEPLDTKYAKDGENINPPLTFSEIPENAQSMALIVEDPDAVSGTFTHWIVYNMSPGTLQIVEGELPISGIEGANDTGELGYYGPQPPAGTGIHRYFFKLYALDMELEVDDPKHVNRNHLHELMEGHIVEQTEIIGTFAAKES